MAFNGLPPNDGTWSAANLLAPKTAFAPSSKPRAPFRSLTLPPSLSHPVLTPPGLMAPQEMQFEYTTTGGGFHPVSMAPGRPASRPQDPTSSSPSGSASATHNMPVTPIFQTETGFSQKIERSYNPIDRSDVPQPKRRKTIQEIDPPSEGFGVGYSSAGFSAGHTGLWTDYVTDQRARGVQAPQSVAQPPVTVVIDDDVPSTFSAAPSKALNAPRGLTNSPNPAAAAAAAADASKQPAMVDLTVESDSSRRDTVTEEVCYGMISATTINADTVPFPKPGAIALQPDWWPQVKVVLRRRSDQQEPNQIIHVYDHTRTVFGTVDARTSAGLVPLLDQGSLAVRTDCRIPTRRKKPGEVAGQAISSSYKMDLMVYGPRQWAKGIGRHLSRKGLHLVSPLRVDAGVKVVNPHAIKEQQPDSTTSGRNGASGEGANGYRSGPVSGSRSAEEIKASVAGVFDSLPKSDDLPEAQPDPQITTELLKHQRQALFFMLHREKDTIPKPSGEEESMLGSIWQIKKDRHGAPCYYNAVTNLTQRDRPGASLGGILADMMGLGKTLSILSLIMTTLPAAREWLAGEPQQPSPVTKGSKGPPFFELTEVKKNAKATLLICPLSTVTNWEEQLKQHVKKGAISWYIYHGTNRTKDINQLSQFDLVITTYGSVSSELSARVRKKKGPHPLEEISWFRVVLDEAHMIREQNTLVFKSICRLQASRRWAVTGTPIQNRLEDLGSLLSFLRVRPFQDRAKFMQYIIQPFKAADPEIVGKLRILIDTITIRRLKNKINLPPREDVIVRLRFSPEEQRVYDWFSKVAQERVRVLTGSNKTIAGRTMVHILRSILQLRLICAGGKDLLNVDDQALMQGMDATTPISLDSDDEASGSDKPALDETKAYEVFYLMQEGNSDACAKCGRKLSDIMEASSERQEDILGYLASCLHVYCPVCIGSQERVMDDCECTKVPKSACFELRRSRADLEHESRSAKSSKGPALKAMQDGRYSGAHTKTQALIKELLANKERSQQLPDKEPPYKSVIFSGWTSHMDLIETALDANGITHVRLDGKMSRSARTAAMDAFRDDHAVQVILVSIMAGGLGLNLTAGNSVYVMEPQFNPAAEAQAVDRVHRLGQKRPVRVVRYIMENSFEEKMRLLQAKKNELANLSLDRRESEKVMDYTSDAKKRLMDLRSLFK